MQRVKTLFALARVFLSSDNGVNASFQCSGGIANSGTIDGHFSAQFFNARLTGLISVSELKHAVTVTASKSVMAFRVLPMTTDLSRLTTGTMNVNAGHKEDQKLILYI